MPYCCHFEELNLSADAYIYALKDSALDNVIDKISTSEAVHIHTAGSVSIDIFKGKTDNYGVIYPLQTFSKEKRVNFDDIRQFWNRTMQLSADKITKIAKLLSSDIHYISSEKRKLLHLSAVFACNFTNYMYVLAEKITKEANLDYNVLLPLIAETADKLKYLTPEQAQTGPALRKDYNTLNKHLDLLKNIPELQNIYLLISTSIDKNFT
ncbi:MAG: DUF2520 domain-containing protein [Paludibacteraceae bacterium]